jgi:hypothetical protein
MRFVQVRYFHIVIKSHIDELEAGFRKSGFRNTLFNNILQCAIPTDLC